MVLQPDFWGYIQSKQNQCPGEVSAAHVYCSMSYNSQDMQTTQVSVSGHMDK